jgi:hypothetical protein
MPPPPHTARHVKDKGQDKDSQITTIRLRLCLLMEAEWGGGISGVGLNVCVLMYFKF